MEIMLYVDICETSNFKVDNKRNFYKDTFKKNVKYLI